MRIEFALDFNNQILIFVKKFIYCIYIIIIETSMPMIEVVLRFLIASIQFYYGLKYVNISTHTHIKRKRRQN